MASKDEDEQIRRLRAENEALRKQRDDAARERDVMRAANVTPEDADRPYSQSVQYWQDKALDYAAFSDQWRVRALDAELALKRSTDGRDVAV